VTAFPEGQIKLPFLILRITLYLITSQILIVADFVADSITSKTLIFAKT
jgi:hypothetical protein